MKRCWALLIALCMILLPVVGVTALLADDSADGSGIGSMIWTFLNSPMGLTIVGAVLAFILGKIFTAKPTWQVYLNKYKPMLIEAVKKAEKAIPDSTANAGLARLDEALKFMLAVNNKLDEASLKKAITAVHSEIELGGNI